MATIGDVKREMEKPFPEQPGDLGTKLVASPLAKAGKWAGKQAVAGIAAVPAAAMDVTNKAANTVNWALGGDPNYFPTNNTQQALAIAGPSSIQPPAPKIAADPLAAIKAKDAAITNTPTVPVNAGITADMVQRPGAGGATTTSLSDTTSAQAAPPIAGVNAFNFNKNQKAGGVVANNSRSDWSPGSRNALAIAGGIDKYGRNYDDQVAHAQTVNDANMRLLAQMSPREQAAFATMNNKGSGSFMRSSAAGEVEAYKQRAAGINADLAGKQAMKIAGEKEKGEMYRVDKTLEGQKYTADATVKAHEATALAGLEKSKIAGQEKQREQSQKDYADRVKSLVGDWSKLNLPTEYAPRLNEFAKLYVAAEDPASNTFMLAPNREGGMYAALPRQYESIYQTYLQSMGHKDAAARVYDMAKKRGHAIDVPDFRRFLPTADAIRNQNQTLIAGVQ